MDILNELKSETSLAKDILMLSKIAKPFDLDDIEETLIPENHSFVDSDEESKFFSIFDRIIAKFLKHYYKYNLFPSSQCIYQLFFYQIKAKLSQIIKDEVIWELVENVTKDVEKYQLYNDCLIIHPLADFGFKNIGASLFFTKKIRTFYFKHEEFLIFPQANSLDEVLRNIKIAINYFKLDNKKVDRDLFKHYQRSRNTKWLIKNPIIIHKMSQTYQGYYENQVFVVKQLEKHISLLYLYKCLSDHDQIEKNSMFDTNRTNNFQTYDEFHYFIINKTPEGYKPECIPRHYKLSRLFETTRLNISIGISTKKSDKEKINKLYQYLTTIYTNYYSSNNSDNDTKMRRSLGYFVRSYQAEYYEDRVLFLCIAFEMILSEGKKDDIGGHISNILLYLTKGNEEDKKKLQDLYNSRSGVAHEGTARKCDLEYCQYLYTKILLIIITNSDIDFKQKDPFSNYITRINEKKIGFKPEIK